MGSGGSAHPRRVVKLYQPWPAVVLAACHTGPPVLPVIMRWVHTLREGGRIEPEVDFTVRRRHGVAIGVLHDRNGEHELLPDWFLVFAQGQLRVLDERSFFERYYEPDRDRES